MVLDRTVGGEYPCGSAPCSGRVGGMPDSILGKLTEYLGQNWPWYKQPLPLALASLVEIRDELRAKNLYDTEEPPFAQNTGELPAGVKEARTADGTYNDLKYPAM